MRKACEHRDLLTFAPTLLRPAFNVYVSHGSFFLFLLLSSFFGYLSGVKVIENAIDLAMYLL